MAEARGRDNWAHTSALLALIANVNRDPRKTPAASPADFNPFEAKNRGNVLRLPKSEAFSMLKAMFVRKTKEVTTNT
jgi:hypothetical protein